MDHGIGKKAKRVIDSFAQEHQNRLPWIGRALSALALFFLFQVFYQSFGRINWGNEILRHAPILLLIAFGWMAASFLLALSWSQLLKHLGQEHHPISVIKVYGISQIGKYIPGNVFQFLSRQGLAKDLGIEHKDLLKSYVWEIAFLALGASCFSLPNLIFIKVIQPDHLILIIFGFSIVSGAIVLLKGIHLFCAFLLNLLYHCCTGIFFSILIFSLNNGENNLFDIRLIGTHITSWLIGFLSFGSPAGIGVKEFILIENLTGFISSEILILSVVLIRICSIAGDLLFFLTSVALAGFVTTNDKAN